MKSCDNILLYILIALTVLCMGYSYFRFIIAYDYIVAYEGECEPTSHSCFSKCTDDTCTETSYYTKIQKYAVDLSAQCNGDITSCDAASECLPADRKCSITYCDPQIDGDICEIFLEEVDIPNDTQASSSTENMLQQGTASTTTL